LLRNEEPEFEERLSNEQIMQEFKVDDSKASAVSSTKMTSFKSMMPALDFIRISPMVKTMMTPRAPTPNRPPQFLR